MNTVAPFCMARMASLWIWVLGGRTPLARRWTIVRGRERSWLGVALVLGGGGGRWVGEVGRRGTVVYFDVDAIAFFCGGAAVVGCYLGDVAFARRHSERWGWVGGGFSGWGGVGFGGMGCNEFGFYVYHELKVVF